MDKRTIQLRWPSSFPRAVILAATALLSGCGQAVASRHDDAARPVHGASAANPVIVELFQSQGCSSCPPANANVNALADRSDILALSFAVTYWDQLGWKDIFGSPRWTQRQWDYAHRSGRGTVYTPQVIVNGSRAIVGANRAELLDTIARAGAPSNGPAISTSAGKVHLGAVARGHGDVWLVHYDPRVINVPISRGENGGRSLPHRDIVKSLDKLGQWKGRPIDFTIPATPAGLRSAILVQDGTGGPILAGRTI